MKCPKCGKTMKEGQLYCEHCGEEIRIVPEFEPELENSIRATLSGVATEITTRTKEKDNSRIRDIIVSDREEKKKKQKTVPARKRKLSARRGILLAAAVLAVLFGAVQAVWYFSPDKQFEKAQKLMGKERYDRAAGYFEHAVQLSPANVAMLNGLSACYYAMGRLEDAEAACLEAIALEGSNEEAYGRLVSIYGQWGEYERLHLLMAECEDSDIRNRYAEYLANPPEADIRGGTYQEAVSIRLIGNGTGTIYYTLDGSEPDLNSAVYISPIPLERGPYTLKAFYVNQYGVQSGSIEERYYIDVVLPEAPSVLPQTGVYGRPHLLEIGVQEDYRVYYTTDGTDPDESSILYDGELWMPVGHSRLRFVTVSPGGVCSEITERQYTLDLHPLLSMEAASNQLLLMLKNAGLLLNLQGELPEQGGRNFYTYKYTLTINDHNYYLYREYYEESAGTGNATGKDYVVNYMSGECYEAARQEDGSYRLYRIESDEGEEGGEAGADENQS